MGMRDRCLRVENVGKIGRDLEGRGRDAQDGFILDGGTLASLVGAADFEVQRKPLEWLIFHILVYVFSRGCGSFGKRSAPS